MSRLKVNQMGIMISGTAFWMFCGHTGAKLVAFLMPDQAEGGSGGMKRFSPTGAAAYGTPRYWSTGPRISLGKGNLTPRNFPY